MNILADQNTTLASVSAAQQRSFTRLGKFLAKPAVVASVTTGIPDPAAVNLLTRKHGNYSSTQVASSIARQSGRDTTITGSTLVADGDIGIDAGRDLTIRSAQRTQESKTASTFKGSGNLGGFFKPAIGKGQNSSDKDELTVTQVASLVASLNGNVKLSAGGTYTQTASDVLALSKGVDGKAGNIDIQATNAVINEAYETTKTTRASQGSQLTLGSSYSVPLYNAAKSAVTTAQATARTEDSRMQALGAASTALATYEVASQVASGSVGGFKVGAALTDSKYQSQSTESSSVAVGSTISGAGNVSIRATGGGSASNITATAATIKAGDTVTLDADNDITLQAAANTNQSTGSSSSSSASVGASWSMGAQNGVTIDLGASGAKGKDLANETTYTNTHVAGGKAVNITSGGDTTIRGGVVAAPMVSATVGGNLEIVSLQDSGLENSKQSSAGGSLSLCIYPICAGAPVTGSAGVGASKGNTNYVSVTEQSGIQAGDGGFDVNVKGNTNLVGAVIESSDAAVDKGLNSFESGSLSMTDLTNTSSGSADGYAVSGGYGGSSPSGSLGIGRASSGPQTGIATSGISGIAGNTDVRTGDTSSAGAVNKPTNVGSLIGEVNAQVTITASATGQLVQYGPAVAGAVLDALGNFFAPHSSGGLTGAQQATNELAQLRNDPSQPLTDQQRADLQTLENFGTAMAAYARSTSTVVTGDQVVQAGDPDIHTVQFLIPPVVGGVGGGAGAAGGFAGGAVSGGLGQSPVYDPETGALVSGSPPLTMPSLSSIETLVAGKPGLSLLWGIYQVLQVASIGVMAAVNDGGQSSAAPQGSRGNPIDITPGTNAPANINGRDYSGHAIDQMQGRGVPPSAVEDTIQNGNSRPDSTYPDSGQFTQVQMGVPQS